MSLLTGLDLGSTSIKAVVFDTDTGQVVSSANRPTPITQYRPEEGHSGALWSEHNPEALWQAVCLCLREAAGDRPVKALAIGSMAEAGLPLGKDGQVLDPIIAWYDRRSEPQAAWLEEQIPPEGLFRLTGQRLSPSFGITKLLWLREHRPDVFKAMRTWLPTSSYILYRLTGERASDYSIASRTFMLDQNSRDWSGTLLELAGLRPEQMPRLCPGSETVGRVTSQAAAETGLPAGLAVAAGGHDHLVASFAAGAFQPGSVVDSTGTAQAVVQVLPAFIPDLALAERGYACYAHVLHGQVILKAGLKAAGNAVDWLARRLSGLGADPDFVALEQAARAGVGLRAGPLWLPHLLESGTPESDRRSRAALIGARIDHDSGDLFRAMLESLAFWLRHNLEEMEALTSQTSAQISLLGGITRLRLLSELKADALDRPVTIPAIPEATAVGASLLGGLACGEFSTPQEAAGAVQYGSVRIEPNPGRVIWYDRLYKEVYRPLYGSLREINNRLASF